MTEQTSPNHAALIKKALLRLEEMERKLRDYEDAVHQPVAIVGMACRFPKASNLNEYARLLADGVDAIGEVPRDRWDLHRWHDHDPARPGRMVVRHGGFVEDAALFDPRFFGLSATEAQAMDPQHRMLLEVAWHAIEDAGLTRQRLREDRAGVFVGLCSNDYGALTIRGPMEELSPYAGVGNAQSVAAGRVAYFLGSNGPAISLDTACSSSLVAVHLAIRSLRARDCRSALAGGVNLLAAPPYTLSFAKAGMLAPDGRCKAFDDSADGYVRGEGCGVVVLKRLSDALADNDRIHAVIRGSAINADGRTSGLTVPSGIAQQQVIQAALADARLEPADVQYVEAHGTGTALGDPIELAALDAVYGQAKGRIEPLRIGSVKTNVGHLEGAAGVASLIKVVLAMRTGRIPRSLHFNHPNSHIDWQHVNVRVAGEPLEWPHTVRRAGISSFGFSGTNAHVVVEGWTERLAALPAQSEALGLTLSARSEQALRDLALAYAARLVDENASALCAAAFTRRELFQQQFVLTGKSASDLRRKLEEFSRSGTRPDVEQHQPSAPDALDSGAHKHVELPLYPFQHEHYWLDHTWDTPAETRGTDLAHDIYRMEWKHRPAGCAATPRELRADCQTDLRTFVDEGDPERARSELKTLETSAAWYAREALAGVQRPLSRYQRLLRRMGAIAATAPATLPPRIETAEAKLLARCAESLVDVLEGRRNPLDLLFPDGDPSAVAAVYQDSRGARLMNLALTRLAVEALARTGASARVLEVGAGTGSATRALLPALRPYANEYWFTDVSPAFVQEARSLFGGDELLRFGVFDIEQDEHTQGFAPQSFELIVAANVLHASQDLKPVLDRLRLLLVPGGLLLLQEGLAPLGWQDLTFGLTDGWWSFRDEDVRAEHPLISGSAWLNLLRECRFECASVEDLAAFGGDVFQQGIVLAKAPQIPVRSDKLIVILDGERCLGDALRIDGPVIRGRVRTGVALEQIAANEWTLDAADASQVRDWIAAIEMTAGKIDTVLHLAGTGLANSIDQRQISGSALHLVQALGSGSHRLLIASAGAVHALEGDACPNYAAATLWGFGKVAALENPNAQVRLIDIDPYDNAAAAQALQSELNRDDREQLIAWRAGRRYTARLMRADAPRLRNAEIHPDASYLITGAFGGLGILTAEWLGRSGAGELILLGRREPDAKTAQRIAHMRASGTRVISVLADVDSFVQIEQAVAKATLPLKGALHLAGTLADGLIENTDWTAFQRVFAPKVLGLLNVHTATLPHPLDFFVIFSSAIGQLGNTGQASHAAASALAEAFAWYRRAQGLHALAIDWGVWSDEGAAARRRADATWSLSGVRGIAPERGIQLLNAYLAADDTHAVVLDLDWQALKDRVVQTPPHLQSLVGSTPRDLVPVDIVAQPEDLEIYLQDQVARLIGFPREQVDLDAGLAELGVDSLMAVRLRNRLKIDRNLEAPMVEFMENQSIRALSESLQNKSNLDVVEGVL